MSVESIITENLDIWTSAIKTKSASGRGSSSKTELYGIKKLRELILSLAVRGKLLPQSITNESAEILYKKIQAERDSLVESKAIKKPKLLPTITHDEIPFEIPEKWLWVRLGDVTNYGQALKAGPCDVKNDTWVLELEDVEKVTSKLLSKVRFSERKFKSSKNVFSEGDVIYGKLRPYLDKVLVADEAGVCTTEMIPVRGYKYIHPAYLRLIMKSPYFVSYANESTHGMNLPRMGTDKARLSLLPLCTEQEQKEIVTKVDELMALCDQLESQTEASIEAHQTLVKLLLETLTNAKDADELNESWQRISAHFDVLFTTEDSIDQLKQTILQLAVMGKLVKQDPNDEPASKLLERIEAEKVQLIKDKKIRKQTELKEVNESDFPFSTPEGWAVVRLGALIPQFQNGVSSRGDKKGKETIVLRLADIKDWRISENDTRRLIINEETIEKYLLKKGDTLIIRVNGSSEIVGRFITVEKVTDAIYCDHFIRMRFPIPCIEPNYLAILGSSRLVRDKISDLFISTAGQKTVNQTHISSLTLSIPPIMEQKRISERVRYLVNICDELKSKLQTVQRTISNVADSVKANY